MGRKRLPKGEGRTARINFTLRPQELEEVRERARKAGLKLSAYCRVRALGGATRTVARYSRVSE